jgi:hypothetical protein
MFQYVFCLAGSECVTHLVGGGGGDAGKNFVKQILDKPL